MTHFEYRIGGTSENPRRGTQDNWKAGGSALLPKDLGKSKGFLYTIHGVERRSSPKEKPGRMNQTISEEQRPIQATTSGETMSGPAAIRNTKEN